jgi:hypothetical protein
MNDPEQSKALVSTEIRVPATLDPAAGSANPFGRAIARRRLSDLNFFAVVETDQAIRRDRLARWTPPAFAPLVTAACTV